MMLKNEGYLFVQFFSYLDIHLINLLFSAEVIYKETMVFCGMFINVDNSHSPC